MKKMSRETKGAAMVEYCLLVAFLGIGAIFTVSKLGETVAETFKKSEVALEETTDDDGSSGGPTGGPGGPGEGSPGSTSYVPPELIVLLTPEARAEGYITVPGRTFVDTEPDAVFQYNPEHPNTSVHNPLETRLYFSIHHEQEYYGKERTWELYGTRYAYGQTYVFPPFWDPWEGM